MRNILSLAGAVVLALASQPARATPDVPLPPHSIVDGQSIGDWGGAWWTWVTQMSDTLPNPLTDPTGALAHQNNNGPVFFVAGNFGGMNTRSFSVAAGRLLLFPLLNYDALQYPVALENQLISNFNTAIPTSLFATIDGVPVPSLASHLETSGVFSMGHAIPGTYGFDFLTPGFPGDPACPGFTPDLLCPSISTGYYLMLELSPGKHVISVGASMTWDIPVDPTYFPTGGQFSIDTAVTSNIDAIPEPASALLLVPGLLGVCTLRRRLGER
jgi:hypothetical protein